MSTVPTQIIISETGGVARSLADKLADALSVKDFGAVGDGVADDTAAIQAAVSAAAGRTLLFPDEVYRVTDTININTEGSRIVSPGAKVFMALPPDHATGRLFYITASNVEFDGLWIDSTGTAPTTTHNKYAMQFAGTSTQHLTDIRVRNCKFTNLPWADFTLVLATHCIYVQFADLVTIERNKMDAPGGSATFFSVVTGARVLNNDINNTGWYSIQLNDGCDGVLIKGNRITGDVPGCRTWGGSVNLMSNSSTGGHLGVGNARNRRIEVCDNYISGKHSYSGPVHIESCSYVSFHHNILENITLTFPSPFYPDGSPPSYIRPYVRPTNVPVNGNEGPNDHIDISDNLCIAGGPGDIGIYADAQDNGSGTLAYSDTLSVRNNRLVSLDSTHYFNNGIIVHGQQGGWKNISITNNQVTGFPNSATPLGGLIGVIGLPGSPVMDTQILNNQLEVVGGTASTSTNTGISIQSDTTRTLVDGNVVKNFYYGIRTLTGSSLISYGLNNVISGSVVADTLFAVTPVAASFASFPSFGLAPAQPGVGELLLQLGVSDVSTGQGQIAFKNGSAADGDFYPFIDYFAKGNNPGLLSRTQITTDTGVNGCYEYNARTSVPGPFSTRPHTRWLNNTAQIASLNPAGALSLNGGISPGSPAGASQPGKLLMGSGIPSNANGNDGDYYFRTDTPANADQRLYVRSGGSWSGAVATGTFTASGAGAVTRAVTSKLGDAVSVKDYGAIGDGTTDATVAIQNAVNAAVGGTVVFPQGTYLTTAPIAIPSNVVVLGYGATVKFSNQNANDVVFTLNAISNVTMAGLEIDGQKASVTVTTEWKHGIQIQSSSRITLRDIYSHHNKGDGLYIGAQTGQPANSDIFIANFLSDSNHRQGLSITNLTGGRFYGFRGTNTSGTAPQAGIDLEPNVDADVVTNLWFYGCDFSGNAGAGGQLLFRDTSPQGDIHFVGCKFDRNALNGVLVSNAQGFSFTDSSFSFNGAASGNFGIEITHNTRNGSFTNSIVTGNGGRGVSVIIPSATYTISRLSFLGGRMTDNSTLTPNTMDGIRLDGATGALSDVTLIGVDLSNRTGTTQRYGISTSSATTTNTKVIGCTAVGNTTAPNLFLDDGATRQSFGNTNIANTTVFSRQVLTFGASITPTLAGGNEQYINANSATAFTINAPTNATTGARLIIRIRNTSGGALGVATWNAVFKMAAWTQPANGFSRWIEFLYDGTNWVETFRSAADIPN